MRGHLWLIRSCPLHLPVALIKAEGGSCGTQCFRSVAVRGRPGTRTAQLLSQPPPQLTSEESKPAPPVRPAPQAALRSTLIRAQQATSSCSLALLRATHTALPGAVVSQEPRSRSSQAGHPANEDCFPRSPAPASARPPSAAAPSDAHAAPSVRQAARQSRLPGNALEPVGTCQLDWQLSCLLNSYSRILQCQSDRRLA